MIYRRRHARLAAFALLSLPLLVAGECEDDPPTGTGPPEETFVFPASWAGTYRIERVEQMDTGRASAGSAGLIGSVGSGGSGGWGGSVGSGRTRGIGTRTTIDVICEGAPVVLDLFDRNVALECLGTIDDAGADITCEGSGEIFDGCTQTVETDLIATRDGGTITGTQTVRSAFEGNCIPPGAVSDTTTITFTAEEIDAGAPGCGDALAGIVPESWGGTWDFTLTEVDCTTGEPTGFETTFSRLYCPGEDALALIDVPEDPARGGGEEEPNIVTWGGFGPDDGVDAFFSERLIGAECDSAQTWHVQLDRDGESAAGSVEVIMYNFPGGSCPAGSERQCFAVTATRDDDDTSGCIPRRSVRAR